MKIKPAILRPHDAAKYIEVSLRTVHRLNELDPTFPRKIFITPRCVGWLKADIDAWLEAKAKGLEA